MAAAAANSITKAMKITIHIEPKGGSGGITAGKDAPNGHGRRQKLVRHLRPSETTDCRNAHIEQRPLGPVASGSRVATAVGTSTTAVPEGIPISQQPEHDTAAACHPNRR